MAITPSDFQEWLKALRERPEWLAELRRLLLDEGLLDLPSIVRELAEAQRRTERRVEALARAQRRLEQRIAALEEAQRRIEQRMNELMEAQRRYDDQQAQALTTAHLQVGKALALLRQLLRATKGSDALTLGEARVIIPDSEADIVLPVKAPDGQTAWLVVEARARQSQFEVTGWSRPTRLGD
ncbi:MAG: hypothetical protein RMM31_05320 [Anaerolineae bacterium]|nr:hypothetical protein [Thermoflexales bacterium]MDW8395647.1 hypothetical protein [Anaerolineae bacterium]